jgi:hypothetical protein
VLLICFCLFVRLLIAICCAGAADTIPADGTPTTTPSFSPTGVRVWWKGKPVDVVLDYLHDDKEIAPDPIRVGLNWDDNFLEIAQELVATHKLVRNTSGSAFSTSFSTRPTETRVADCLRAKVRALADAAEKRGTWTRPVEAKAERVTSAQLFQTDINLNEMSSGSRFKANKPKAPTAAAAAATADRKAAPNPITQAAQAIIAGEKKQAEADKKRQDMMKEIASLVQDPTAARRPVASTSSPDKPADLRTFVSADGSVHRGKSDYELALEHAKALDQQAKEEDAEVALDEAVHLCAADPAHGRGTTQCPQCEAYMCATCDEETHKEEFMAHHTPRRIVIQVASSSRVAVAVPSPTSGTASHAAANARAAAHATNPASPPSPSSALQTTGGADSTHPTPPRRMIPGLGAVSATTPVTPVTPTTTVSSPSPSLAPPLASAKATPAASTSSGFTLTRPTKTAAKTGSLPHRFFRMRSPSRSTDPIIMTNRVQWALQTVRVVDLFSIVGVTHSEAHEYMPPSNVLARSSQVELPRWVPRALRPPPPPRPRRSPVPPPRRRPPRNFHCTRWQWSRSSMRNAAAISRAPPRLPLGLFVRILIVLDKVIRLQ